MDDLNNADHRSRYARRHLARHYASCVRRYSAK